MRRHLIRLVLPLVGVLAFVALAGGIAFAARSSTQRSASGTPIVITPTTPTGSPGDLTYGTWTLTRLVVDGVETPLASRVPTLQFHPRHGDVMGSAGCNGYSAAYILDGVVLHIGNEAYTQMACLGPGLMDEEAAYLDALPRVGRLSVAGDTLTLASDNGRVQLTFRRA